MIKKYKKGFSMVELLLALLVISIVLSAAMPTVVRNARVEREQIWRWFNINTAISFGKNSSQRVIIGLSEVPDSDIVNGNHASDSPSGPMPDGANLPALNGKVSIIKPGGIQQSHIDMFSASGAEYAGRISADPSNIAFGTGVLKNASGSDNTGIGSYALYNAESANNNTALGYSALRNNENGNHNTAIGKAAGYFIQGHSENTLIGYNAGRAYYLTESANDRDDITSGTPERNTIIGANACSKMNVQASGNICIGYHASGKENLKGDKAFDRLFIGSDTTGLYTTKKYTPDADNDTSNKSSYVSLIAGHVNQNSTAYDKDISFNAKFTRIKSFDSDEELFIFDSSANYNDLSNNYSAKTEAKYYIDKDTSTDKYTGIKTYVNYGTDPDIIRMDVIPYKYNQYSPSQFSQHNYSVFYVNNLSFKTAGPDADPAENTTTTNEYTLSTDSAIKFEAGTTNKSSVTLSTGGLTFLHSTSSGGSETYDNFPITYNANATAPPKIEFITFSKMGASLEETGTKDIKYNAKSDISIAATETNAVFTVPDGKFINVHSKIIGGDANKILIDADTSKISLGGGKASLQGGTSGLITAGSVKINSMSSPLSSNLNSAINTVKSQISAAQARCNACIITPVPSDIRLKNIKGEFKAGLREISKLKIKNFTYKTDPKKEPHVGVIAQELKKIFPNSVYKNKETGYLNIRTEEIFYAMINSIKQLYSISQDIAARISGLDSELNELQKENQMLKAQNADFEKRLEQLEKE